MPVFRWDDLEDTLITPKYTSGIGKTIMGKGLILQRILNVKEERNDGVHKVGGHAHPEEQMIICLKKGRKARLGQEWVEMEEGDIALVPPHMEHEAISDEDHLFLSIKTRIPGHSWYDGSWVPGAEEDWKRAQKILEEMDKKYKERTPWSK